MMNCMYYILALLIVSCFSTINHTNQESPEYVSEQCVLNFAHSKSISDTLLASICDYALSGYKYEGDAEAVSEYLYEVFYRNDSIGDFLDTFFNKRCYSIKLQDTIRIRTMFFIEGFLNIRGDIIPLNVDSCDNYPYFQNHNSILNNDSLYLKYF